MAAAANLMSQASLGPFMDETVPGAPVPIVGSARRIANHYYSHADWSPPRIAAGVRAARGLLPSNGTEMRRYRNKMALLTIKPGSVGRNTYTWKCRSCTLRHDDARCTVGCYFAFRAARFDVAASKLEIRQTNNIGANAGPAAAGAPPQYGIFVRAGQRILRHEWLGEYIGELLDPSHPGSLDGSYSFNLDRGDLGLLPPLEIDSARRGNWTRFVNHRCDPNVELVTTQAGKIRMLCFRARQNIEAGHEIFIHYGRPYFTSRSMACQCNYQGVPHVPTLAMARVRRWMNFKSTVRHDFNLEEIPFMDV